MSRRRQAWRRRTSLVHVVSLGACLALTGLAYPEGVILGTALLTSAVLIESLRRESLRELAAAGVILACVHTVSSGQVTVGMFQAFLRMILAFLVLVPARPGALKFLVPLLVAETLFTGPPEWHELVLLALIPPWLALDAWLADGVRRSRNLRVTRPVSLARPGYLVLPGLVVSLLLFGTGTYASARDVVAATESPLEEAEESAKRPSPMALPAGPTSTPGGQGGVSGISRDIEVRDTAWTDLDNGLVGQVTLDVTKAPATVYVRTLCLPDLRIAGETVKWVLARHPLEADGRGATLHTRHPPVAATVHMFTDLGGLVPHPDGAARIHDLLRKIDPHGNLFLESEDAEPGRLEAEAGAAAWPDRQLASVDTRPYLDIPLDYVRRLEGLAPIAKMRHLEGPRAARLAVNWLADRCEYDLEEMAPDMWSFLTGPDGTRQGHCQYFASAAVLMLRAAGHPARCVTGYASTEASGTTFNLRHLHAHAWCEVLSNEGLWHRVEATPAYGLSHRGSRQHEEIGYDPDLPDMTIGLFNGIIALLGTTFVILLVIGVFGGGKRLLQSRRPTAETLFRSQLESLCRAFGVRVHKSTTVTELVDKLEEVTHRNLRPHLDEYLRFRYGNEDINIAWPTIDELRPDPDPLS